MYHNVMQAWLDNNNNTFLAAIIATKDFAEIAEWVPSKNVEPLGGVLSNLGHCRSPIGGGLLGLHNPFASHQSTRAGSSSTNGKN
jgi:hypothetical protein